MKFENTEVWGFEHAFRGLRNPKNSWDRSDSGKLYWDGTWYHKELKNYFTEYGVNFYIGENDMKLAQTLIKAGNEHRKFMRQIFVSVDITAGRNSTLTRSGRLLTQQAQCISLLQHQLH